MTNIRIENMEQLIETLKQTNNLLLQIANAINTPQIRYTEA